MTVMTIIVLAGALIAQTASKFNNKQMYERKIQELEAYITLTACVQEEKDNPDDDVQNTVKRLRKAFDEASKHIGGDTTKK